MDNNQTNENQVTGTPVASDASMPVTPVTTTETITTSTATLESTPVSNPVLPPVEATPVVTAPVVVKKSNNKIVIIIVVILLVLCCLCSSVFGYLYYIGKNAVDTATTDINTTLDNASGSLDEANKAIDAANKAIADEQAKLDAANSTDSTSGTTGSTFTNTPDFTKMPGTAICDQLLCSDIWYNIIPLADVYTSCSDLSLKTTKLVSKAADSKTWKETWTLTGCGKDYDFGVDYTSPVGGGTDFAISKNF